ncbi:MAG TPA: HlyD family efflux transporter periplasmic adaptor subunit [Bryobacteraceae bacterium]
MDVPRGKEVARRRLIRRIVLGVVAAVVIGGATIALARLKPAAPSVDMSGLWPGTVKRGPLEIEVHGLGTLKPEEIHFLAAAQDCRVADVVRLPGLEILKPNDVIVVLSDPDLELEAEKAEWTLKQDEANLAKLRVTLQSDNLTQESTLADLVSQYTSAKLTADRDLQLTKLNLLSDLNSRLSVNSANQLRKRVALAKQQLKIAEKSDEAQIEAQQVTVESDRAAYELKKKQVDQLTIRAGINGQLTEVDVNVGQRVTAGTILAKIADPTKLKAELQIAETQMKGVAVGQKASIDTRNGFVPGRVMQIAPSAVNGTVNVDVKLLGALPQGSRADQSVDGTIEEAHLEDVKYIDRPVNGEKNTTIGLFKVDPGGKGAERVNVKLGEASVNKIQVLAGLKVGDRVILSDMSQYDSYQRIRLND